MTELEKAKLEYFTAATVFARAQLPELARLMLAADMLAVAQCVAARESAKTAAMGQMDGAYAKLETLQRIWAERRGE